MNYQFQGFEIEITKPKAVYNYAKSTPIWKFSDSGRNL